MPSCMTVGHIRDDHGKVDGRVKIRERLNIWALDGIESHAFKTNRGIVFSDILSGQTRTIDTARAGATVKARTGKVLSIDAPGFSRGGQLFGQIAGRSWKGAVTVIRYALI